MGTQSSGDLQHMPVAAAAVQPGWTSDLWDRLTCPQILLWLKRWALVIQEREEADKSSHAQRGCSLQDHQESAFSPAAGCFPSVIVLPRCASSHHPPEQHRVQSAFPTRPMPIPLDTLLCSSRC